MPSELCGDLLPVGVNHCIILGFCAASYPGPTLRFILMCSNEHDKIDYRWENDYIILIRHSTDKS